MFEEFPKIARLSRECVITEKIDGTNAQIHIVPRTEVFSNHAPFIIADSGGLGPIMFAGSRTKYLSVGRDGVKGGDNFGFAAWVKANADALWSLGEGRHFGEWWGSGIQRGYGLSKGEKRFSLFNTARWADDRDREKFPTDRPACCSVVPVLYRGEFNTDVVEAYVSQLGTTGSVAAPGFMQPEGVVIYHSAAGLYFKKTLEKDEEGKEQRAHRLAHQTA